MFLVQSHLLMGMQLKKAKKEGRLAEALLDLRSKLRRYVHLMDLVAFQAQLALQRSLLLMNLCIPYVQPIVQYTCSHSLNALLRNHKHRIRCF